MGWSESYQEISTVEIVIGWGWVLSLLRIIMRLNTWSRVKEVISEGREEVEDREQFTEISS